MRKHVKEGLNTPKLQAQASVEHALAPPTLRMLRNGWLTAHTALYESFDERACAADPIRPTVCT